LIDYDNEPPILEELGIDISEIMKKYKAILTQRGFEQASTYEDMAGAIFVMFVFGLVLLCVSNFSIGPSHLAFVYREAPTNSILSMERDSQDVS
jgi:hypothetical protein